ncbi:MAG: DUF3316 domain-containing protein [Bacteroides sp.]|nr:DUF3316 domain-containing protein [Bacteroides sp.]
MKKLAGIFMIIAALALASVNAIAQDTITSTIERPVYSSYMVKVGSNHLADTYLSPIKYQGWTTGFSYERLQAMKFNPIDWTMRLQLSLDISRTINTAGNVAMWNAVIAAQWAMYRRWKLPYGLSAGVGPGVQLQAGALYLDRNGNNPVSAKASFTFDAAGYLAWNTKLLSKNITFRYEATLPVVGAFFSPDYGELYYEIYLGNHSGLAHCAWWGNYRRIDHQLTADIHFGATTLRLGYSGSLFSSKVNDIVTHQFSHSAVIGISTEWISLNPTKKLSSEATIISATY